MGIRDLFYATPARLKFLKAERTEAAAAVDAVERLAMAYPAVGFTLADERRTPVRLAAGQGDLLVARLARLGAVLGRDFADNSVPVDAARGGVRLPGSAALPTPHTPPTPVHSPFFTRPPVRAPRVSASGAARGGP